MRLPAVRTGSGADVTLLFAPAGVHVLGRFIERGGLFRLAGGAMFAAFACGALGVGSTHVPPLSIAFFIATVALAVVAVPLAVAGWVIASKLERVVRNGATTPTIPTANISSARSSETNGAVTVSVETQDGQTHEFTAAGMAGRQLARQFALLLGVSATPGSDSAD